jgi:hypothetical protein
MLRRKTQLGKNGLRIIPKHTPALTQKTASEASRYVMSGVSHEFEQASKHMLPGVQRSFGEWKNLITPFIPSCLQEGIIGRFFA